MSEPTVEKIPVENRLRKLFPAQVGRTRETIVEAADTIEQLRAENARLKMDKEKIRNVVWSLYSQGPEAIDLALAELTTKEQS